MKMALTQVLPTPGLTRTGRRLLHLTVSSGGCRAILGGAGTILALEHAGVGLASLGGISGGALPAALYAAGVSAHELVRLALDIEFASLLQRSCSVWQVFKSYPLKERLKRTRPGRSVYSSEKLGAFLDSYLPSWPHNFWTAAVQGEDLLVFTRFGIFKYVPGRVPEFIAENTIKPSEALRGSCAIPGLIEAIWCEPSKGRLFDGGLGPEGRYSAQIPGQFFQAFAEDLLICDAGPDDRRAKLFKRLWRLICGRECICSDRKRHVPGTIVVNPQLEHVYSLDFDMPAKVKRQAIASFYQTTMAALLNAGVIT